MSASTSPPLKLPWFPAVGYGQEIALALALLVEASAFTLLGMDLTSPANALQVVRLNVEIGLLALALTPVIITGGIDLSVGSLVGLSAVLFGKLWRDAGLPIEAAALATLAFGALAGGLNALLITRLRLPPLIVTLGTFSLFRGLAEGLTAGGISYYGFPPSFSFWGQGELFGVVPPQVVVFVAAAVGFWLLLHHSTVGRTLYAIGLSPEGARHAGIPVGRRLALVYMLSGLVASLAALLSVARLDQAKADLGMGYELKAITAVVLGGTSIFGGRGTLAGTFLGFLLIAVLQNGLPVTGLPSSLAGPLIGGLLLGTISLGRLPKWLASLPRGSEEELQMKNAHVAVLSAVILLAALIVAGSNWLLVRTMLHDRPLQSSIGEQNNGGPERSDVKNAKPITIAMMPKSLGNSYFKACQKGANEAAKELGVELIWDGPTEPDSAAQSNFVEAWITRGVDVIAVAVEDRVALSAALKKARQKGIKVITWDSDAEPEARDFFVNQATPQGIGETLMDEAGRILGGKGEFAIITASLTSANMIEWEKSIEARRAAKYPNIKRVALLPCQDLQDKAFQHANTILNAHPNAKLIMAICSPAVPGSAEAVKQAQRKDVKVIGLGLPNENKPYVHEGITEAVILWNTMDLGYLAVHAAKAVKTGALKAGEKSFQGGRLGRIDIEGDNLLLGRPFVFTKNNIDKFDF